MTCQPNWVLHRLGDLAGLELEGGFGEGLDHAVLGEEAEIAAVVLGARVLGELARDLGEILAALDAGVGLLRLVLGLDQDVAGADLVLRREGLDGVVVELAGGLGRHRLLGLAVEIVVEQGLVARIGELAREVRAVADLGGLGGAGAELEVDEVADRGGRASAPPARSGSCSAGSSAATARSASVMSTPSTRATTLWPGQPGLRAGRGRRRPRGAVWAEGEPAAKGSAGSR